MLYKIRLGLFKTVAGLSCVGCALLLAETARAACPDDAEIAAYLADFQAARTSNSIAGEFSLQDAECSRGRLVDALAQVLGRVVGYKAGFTNPVVQRRVGLEAPAWGVMFGRHMVNSGTVVRIHSAARLHFEADLIAVVKDPGLADATTPLEALSHLDAIVPFIELPDTMADELPNGTGTIARNVAFHGGVIGPKVGIVPSAEFADALASMTVVLSEGAEGKEIGRARGDALMGHPLNAAIWLAAALKADGIALKPGDLLSLGAYAPLTPARPGMELTATYIGLPGNPSVSVRFEE